MTDTLLNKASSNTASSRDTFPRWFLIGACALIVSSVAIAGFTRLTGVGVSRVSQSEVMHSVAIQFVEMSNGGMKILRANDATELAVLAADGSGFLRGVARSLFRQRLLGKIDRFEPFELARRIDGKYFITDPAFGSRMELDGFGPTNTQTVAAVLEAGLVQKTAGFRNTSVTTGSAK